VSATALEPLLAETGTVDSAGCPIRWYAGGSGAPTLVLVHGGGAHSGWWELMLGTLTARQRVVTLDLAGHGDSGWRPDGYPTDLWVADVAAVIEAEADGPVALVGHSLGGRICTAVAARHPMLVSTLVTIDAVVPGYADEPIPRVRPRRFYETESDILAAFKLMPPQPPAAPDVMHRLALRSITELPDGRYSWKFDPAFPGQMADRFETSADVRNVRCPVTIVVGGQSAVVRPNIPTDYVRLLGRPAEIITLPDSNHHIPLDAPEQLNALLAAVTGPSA
jgi:pimeloyl-ACP methyl ester carboxylesterase